VALKTRKKQIEVPAITQRRKTKFQADLAPADDRSVRLLKEELQLNSNSDFLSDAVALFRWAVSERKLGHRIMSESASGERKVLLFPRLERVAPDLVLPRVDIKWTGRELESLAALVSAGEASRPTDALVRAMRD
jgi:hypothetical protein